MDDPVPKATPLSGLTVGGQPSVEHEFEVRQRILGPDDRRFTLIDVQRQARQKPASADHSDEAFWRHGGGCLCNDMVSGLALSLPFSLPLCRKRPYRKHGADC